MLYKVVLTFESVDEILKCDHSNDTLGSRGYFFLMDTDGSRRSRVNEAQSAEKKKFFSPRPFFLL